VVPGLFALTFKVIADPQMAIFATFGGFATLVLASFGGTRRDKAIAHLGLAVAGSVALIIGTAVSGITWLAALATIPVAFAIFFAGVIGPNAASGVTAALLAYVLPVASAGSAATIPARLAGWWLASAVGTAAVLLLSPKSPGDRLRASAAATAAALSRQLSRAARGERQPGDGEAVLTAKHQLMASFAATPYRPTGLATADQALGNVVQVLEWCVALVSDALGTHLDLARLARPDRELLSVSAGVLGDVAALLSGSGARPDLAGLERARAASAAHQRDLARERDLAGSPDEVRISASQAFHAQAIAVAARTAAADALIATRRADPETVAVQRRSWYAGTEAGPPTERRTAALSGFLGVIGRHASVRSVWFTNAARGAIGLALAVAVADLSGVQHGFWVVLGTMSVLRTNAAATGGTALRALAGTVIGFAAGAALLLAIGTGQTALWVALPIAVLVAAYTPGTAPFAVGQAAFTITVVVLFNLLAPAGWKVGLLRIQDVAIGCAVSLVVGVLFWPRGAGSLVGDDLADAFRRGGAYLVQAVDWALGVREEEPDTAVAAVTAGMRLDDALRGFFAEQGSKRMDRGDLWMLVMASMRLRLTANSLASLHGPAPGNGPASPASATRAALRQRAEELAAFYDQVADEVGRPVHSLQHPLTTQEVPPLTAPRLTPIPKAGADPRVQAVELAEAMVTADAATVADGAGAAVTTEATPIPARPHLVWVREHLHHLSTHAQGLGGPAMRLAELRRRPWWR
jgi:uncharacterized membrane protein YccC